ncbi:RING/FYVE/PHD zinc finger superfamily protein [Hibiscus syriacus]|uniref:RING/FYVE/PHD zinc finger superfamily protein n=1 Tax=Hibiscus syriacus TaxID=106335 RepID=A0A6A2ZF13_HIBSY|nr:RING/FYVE/PHD zinc finger superfamily protein [Hibiscus syriacus]
MENILMGLFGAILGLLAVVLAVHAMTCEEAIATLMPCKSYLTTSEPSPTLACCQALATVNASASTTWSRRDLCKCFCNIPNLGDNTWEYRYMEAFFLLLAFFFSWVQAQAYKVPRIRKSGNRVVRTAALLEDQIRSNG